MNEIIHPCMWRLPLSRRWHGPIMRDQKDIELKFRPALNYAVTDGRAKLQKLLDHGTVDDFIELLCGRAGSIIVRIVEEGIIRKKLKSVLSAPSIMSRIAGQSIDAERFRSGLREYYPQASMEDVPHLIYFERHHGSVPDVPKYI